jgi:hypothetical protein
MGRLRPVIEVRPVGAVLMSQLHVNLNIGIFVCDLVRPPDVGLNKWDVHSRRSWEIFSRCVFCPWFGIR